MSSRLGRSYAAMARRMLMSRHRLFVFVEGQNHDMPFFEGIVRETFAGSGQSYTIFRIDALDPAGGFGGKHALADYYDWLRHRQKLNQQNRATKVSAAFCLDSDFDLVLARPSRSLHKLYTRRYNVEAEVIANAPLVPALISGVSLRRVDAQKVAHDLGGWLSDLGDLWSQWLRLCVGAVAVKSSCGVTPRRPSQVQRSEYGEVDIALVRQMRDEILRASPVPNATEALLTAERKYDSYVRRAGGAERLLNGKHLGPYLEYRVRRHRIGSKGNVNGFGPALTRVMLGCLDFGDPWASEYRAFFGRFLHS